MVGMSSVWPMEENPEVERGEAALVAAARHDRAAFSQLYRQYLPRIYRYLLARLPTPDDAADACQQVFLKALEAIPSYDERGLPFAAWIFRIARNTAIDAVRRRRSTVPWEHLPESAHPHEPEQPESAFLRRESLSRFEELLAPLDDDRRDLLTLRFVAGLTSKEIAGILGKSDGAVRTQLSRTLKTLKEHHHAE